MTVYKYLLDLAFLTIIDSGSLQFEQLIVTISLVLFILFNFSFYSAIPGRL